MIFKSMNAKRLVSLRLKGGESESLRIDGDVRSVALFTLVFSSCKWIKRTERTPNSWVRKLCGVKKEVDERIDERFLRGFERTGRGDKDKII